MSASGAQPKSPPVPLPTWLAPALLVLATLIAYRGSFTTPFIFDDLPGIVRNPTIRPLSSLGDVLLPAQATGTSVVGRPIVNLSLALNYAAGGLDVRGYHAFNLLVHLGAALLLLGLAQRTRWNGVTPGRWLAFAIALLWALHPLQTESVACVIQLTELLVGFFFFLTLYCFVRGWGLATVLACALGMATKEVMVTAPVIVLLYDRTFVVGSFAAAWRRHRGIYLGLAATWFLLLALVLQGSGRGGTVGVGLGVSAWEYLLTQCRAIVLYLQLAVWPAPLVLDYGMPVERSLASVWPHALLLLALAAATFYALRRRPVLGFLGAWLFITLAPSSSVVPLATQTISEHRMYLPLAACVVGFVAAFQALLGRRALPGALVVALVLGGVTSRRIDDYADPLTIWADTVAKVPANARAHYNYANALSAAGRAADAVRHYETALRLEPRYAAAHYNLAGALVQLGREREAIAHYETSLQLEPDSADTHANLAAVLIRFGRMPEAIAHYEAAAKHGMLAAEEHRRFGRALAEVGRLDDALKQLDQSLRLDPKQSETHVILGMVHAVAGRVPQALKHFADAVVVDPQNAAARLALADALLESSRPAEAISHYEAVLRLAPQQAGSVHTSLGNALARLGRALPAIEHYEAALRLNPNDAEARTELNRVREAALRHGVLKK